MTFQRARRKVIFSLGMFDLDFQINVLKVSDLVKAVDTPWLRLIRPKPRPWEDGFVPPGTSNSRIRLM
jgi:hypothetical protein